MTDVAGSGTVKTVQSCHQIIAAHIPTLGFSRDGCPFCHPTNSVKAMMDGAAESKQYTNKHRNIIFITCHQSCNACRAQCCYGKSICLSVSLSCASFASKQMDILSHFWRSGRGIILVFWAPAPLQNSKGTCSAGALYAHGMGEICNYCHLSWKQYEIGLWLLWISNMKS